MAEDVKLYRCCDCKQSLLAKAFAKNASKTHRDGLQGVCRACKKVRAAKSNAKNRAERRQRFAALDPETVTKRCLDCGEELPLKHFGKNPMGALGRLDYCKPCGAKRLANWRQENPEYEAAYREAHPEVPRAAQHKRRKRKLAQTPEGNHFTPADWKELVEAYGPICWYCNEVCEPTVDHLISLDNGGSNSIENIGIACKSCNSKKGSKSMLHFLMTLT